jgi:CubicO group peptidase (beta-lactamase class C family)
MVRRMTRTGSMRRGVVALCALTLSSMLVTTSAQAGSGAQAAASRADARTQLVRAAKAADSHCVAVVRKRKTLIDRDLAPEIGSTQAWSVTKSVASLLVGIAQDQGLLDLDDRVSTYVPQWRGTDSATVTVRHLLSNTSGREWDFTTDYLTMAGKARNKTRFAINLGQDSEPGTTWFYNNSAIQVLEQVLQKATGGSVRTFANANLFGPLGMTSTTMAADAVGNPLLYAGVMTTCTDLARLGVMLAQEGRYDGRRIVSKQFWKRATQRSSSQLNAAYGLLFWVNEPGTLLPAVPAAPGTPVAQGPLVPAAGEDAFWAIGLNQQLLFVDPVRDIVAVRLGDPAPAEAGFTVRSFTELALAAARQR